MKRGRDRCSLFQLETGKTLKNFTFMSRTMKNLVSKWKGNWLPSTEIARLGKQLARVPASKARRGRSECSPRPPSADACAGSKAG